MPASQFALEFDGDLTVNGRDPHLLNQAADYRKGLATVVRVAEHLAEFLYASAIDRRKGWGAAVASPLGPG